MRLFILLLLQLLVLLPIAAASAEEGVSPLIKDQKTAEVTELQKAVLAKAYGKLPLYFIENKGQVDGAVKFYEKGAGHATFFTGDGVVLSLTKTNKKTNNKTSFNNDILGLEADKDRKVTTEAVTLSFVGSNTKAMITAKNKQGGHVNYFIGKDKTKWHSNIPTYGAVTYLDVYKNIDIKFYGNNTNMEHDVIVRPGGDISNVKFAYEGVKGLKVTKEGDLEVSLNDGKIIEKKPVIYQEIKGKRLAVDGSYKIFNGNTYGFRVASYDHSKKLVIDPVLVYSTYLGGTDQDTGGSITVDSAGNAYVTGFTFSQDFPLSPVPVQLQHLGSFMDAFVTKIDPTGTFIIYSTYLGGSYGESGNAIAVDASGNVYVSGKTRSTDFPIFNAIQTTNRGSSDAFVTKLNPSGSSLVYSTYLGGSSADAASNIAVDVSGNAYVTGYTGSTNFPTLNAIQGTLSGLSDAFVTKIDPTGTFIIYSTYLGGSYGESGNAIAVDPSGNAYVSGHTASTDFPLLNAIQGVYGGGQLDVFVTKLNPAGSALIYSTYLGGNGSDNCYSIALDNRGNTYLTGQTASTDFPLFNPIQRVYGGGSADAFVTKINPSGSAFIYSTYLGGNRYSDVGSNIAVDVSGNAYVTGYTGSTNFPTLNAIQGTFGGRLDDAFVTKINPSGSTLLYSTYIGGKGDDLGYGIALDATGNAYVTGYTGSTNFPRASPMQGTFGGGFSDAFITKIGPSIQSTFIINGGTLISSTQNPDGSVTYVIQGTGPLGGIYSVTLPAGTQASPGQNILIKIVDQAAGAGKPKFEIENAVLPLSATKTMTMPRPGGAADRTMCLMDIAPESEIKVGKTCKAQPGKGTVDLPGTFGSFDCGPGLPCDLLDGNRRHVSYDAASVTISGLLHSRLYLNVAHVPVAAPGLDQDIHLGTTVYLDGTASFDADGDPLTYAWTIDSQPGTNPITHPVPEPVTLIGSTTSTPNFIPNFTGRYVISLIVSDGTYSSAAATVTVNVTDNLPPIATAAATPLTGDAPLSVTFNASGSDPENGPLTYFWDFGDGATGLGVTTSYTYNSANAQPYTAIVTVTDDFGNTAQASVAITVTAPNQPPTVRATASTYNGPTPLDIQFTAVGADPEGVTLTYSWNFGDGGTSTLTNPLHTYSSQGSFVATVTASDGNLTATDSVTINVGSPLACNVREVSSDEGKEGKVEGKVDLKAGFTYTGLPSPSDLIEVTFDGLTLISEPFTVFTEERKKPGVYEFEDKDLHVKMDFNKMTIKVSKHKMVLNDVDNSNGVDVVISFGSASCTDHLVMQEHEDKDHKKKMSHKEKD